MLRDYLPAGPIVLDASAIINLLGCGETTAVFAGVTSECIVEQRTLGEVLRHPIPGRSHTEEIQNLRDEGRLNVVRMNDGEYDVFLSLIQGSLSTRLDTGESAAIAVATSRRYGVVLDEAKARRVHAEMPDQIGHISTLKLLISAGYNNSWTPSHLWDVVQSSMQYARLGVPKEDRHLLASLSGEPHKGSNKARGAATPYKKTKPLLAP